MNCLSGDILRLLLKAENEYRAAIEKAAEEAEIYAGDSKKKQADYVEELKREWHLFEKSEHEKLDKMLEENEKKLDVKTSELKNRLQINQKNKADLIGERLKSEVISLYGSG